MIGGRLRRCVASRRLFPVRLNVDRFGRPLIFRRQDCGEVVATWRELYVEGSCGHVEGSSAFVGFMLCTSMPLRRIANGAGCGPHVRGLD